MVTFSEAPYKYLPPERLNFVLSELARVIRRGGILLMSLPNQASLENRLVLLKGKSILAMPHRLPFLGDTFGHIRLYTRSEMIASYGETRFFSRLQQSGIQQFGIQGTERVVAQASLSCL